MKGLQKNCIMNVSAVLAFVVREEDGMWWVDFKIVGEVGRTREVVVSILPVIVK